jgi:SAM-dependent methyltransferase
MSDATRPWPPLVEMATGYFRSRALATAARLQIADAIGDGERTVAQLATDCKSDPDALYRLLRALASFGIVEESQPATFKLTPLGRPLRKNAPDSDWPSVIFWAEGLAQAWGHLTECVRTGSRAWELMQRDGIVQWFAKESEAGAIFRAVMGTAPAEDSMPLARGWDFSKMRVVADLGGGGGSLIHAILTAYPNVKGMLVDRKESIEQAAPRFAELASRCEVVAADLSQSVPGGADVHILKHVLHGCTDDAAAVILRNCRAVLPADGRLLVIEFVLPDLFNVVDKELEHRVMSDLNMMVVTGGKERSASQWKTVIERSGFKLRRIVAVPGESASIIEAAPV